MTDRVEMLETENAVLREYIALLERDCFGTDLVFPVAWALSYMEERVCGILLSRPLVTKDMLMHALYRGVGAVEAGEKITDVYICKVRRKLKPFGIQIVTRLGRGWLIDELLRSVLQKQLKPDTSIDSARLEMRSA